jgi:hypothetical protein
MTKRYEVNQSSLEAKPYSLSFQLPTGVTLTDVTIAHTPPTGGDSVTPTKIGSVVSPNVTISVPAGMSEGENLVSVLATTDDAKVKPEILLAIDVER